MGGVLGSVGSGEVVSVQLHVRDEVCVVGEGLWLYCQWIGCVCVVSCRV